MKVKAKPTATKSKQAKPKRADKQAVVLLAGGNHQIAKAECDAPAQT